MEDMEKNQCDALLRLAALGLAALGLAALSLGAAVSSDARAYRAKMCEKPCRARSVAPGFLKNRAS